MKEERKRPEKEAVMRKRELWRRKKENKEDEGKVVVAKVGSSSWTGVVE